MEYRIIVMWLKRGRLSIKYFDDFASMETLCSYLEIAEDNGAALRYVAQGYNETREPTLYDCNCWGDVQRLLKNIEWAK